MTKVNDVPAPFVAPEVSVEQALEPEFDYEGLGGNYPLHINMIAGSMAGISEHAVMFPVDLVRVRSLVTCSAHKTDSYASANHLPYHCLYRYWPSPCSY